MTRCTSCSAEISMNSRFCGACGAVVAPVPDDATLPSVRAATAVDRIASAAGSPETPHPTLDGGRFLPGTMLANRYRVVALLGRGGMGEVYRVDDLKLGQPAALKFLPEALERDESRMTRFLNEVRVALRVTHPNVCRVHDIGEVDGHHYLSMEYVDGENLASLLRQVGHFPTDKAVQVAQQLCAGLAAAHEQGILHRDLKPANVMIDGRGQVKITDFGLASLEVEIDGSDARSGTPAYMAPEQWSGREVTVRSDVYSLGLVLFELLTGKPTFSGSTPAETARLHQESAPTSPASLVDGLDPAVERVILRCLEKDPSERPASARAVAAALPGGDPLAAALAAGETPSPELVAQAEETRGMPPAAAWAALATFLAAVGMLVFLDGKAFLVGMVPLDKSPQVLVERARGIIQDLGFTEPRVDELYAFGENYAYLTHLEQQPATRGRWDPLRASQPAAYRFYYRQSREYLERSNDGGIGNWFGDPPPTQPGMIEVGLDLQGRLLSFQAVPNDYDESTEQVLEPEWSSVLSAAGMNAGTLTRVEPRWTPHVFADRRAAWEGVYPQAPDVAVRLEAAAYRGRPVSFLIVEPWTRPSTTPDPPEGFWNKASELVSTGWYLIVLLGAALVALRNVRLGRGDRKAATRLALYLGAVRMLWMLGAHHIPTQGELGTFTAHLAWSAYRIVLVWVFYLAFEPYARRLWPRMLVSWVRVLNGRFRDPLVGRDLLFGLLYGSIMALIIRLSIWLPDLMGLSSGQPESWLWASEALRGARHTVAAIAGLHTQAVLNTFIGIMLFLVLRLLLRRTWIAAAVMTILAAIMFNPGSGSPYAYIAAIIPTLALFWFVLFRYGFLAIMIATTVSDLLRAMPLTLDVSAWYGGITLLTLFLSLGLAFFAFYSSLGGKPIFRDEIFEAEAHIGR
jgi:serine/threonine-protein kinase